MAHSDCGWTCIGVQVKLWDPLRTRAVLYLSDSEVMFHKEALYEVYVPLPLPVQVCLCIGFGIGTMVQDGFQLSQLLRDGQLSFRCVSLFHVVVIVLHVVFCFFQTFYVFKSHRVRYRYTRSTLIYRQFPLASSAMEVLWADGWAKYWRVAEGIRWP